MAQNKPKISGANSNRHRLKIASNADQSRISKNFIYSKRDVNDPKTQINQSLKAQNNKKNIMMGIFERQLINEEAIEILEKGSKNMEDYFSFINVRYKALVKKLEEYQITEAEGKKEYPTELEGPSIVSEPEVILNKVRK